MVGQEWKWRQEKAKTVREVKTKCREVRMCIKRGVKASFVSRES